MQQLLWSPLVHLALAEEVVIPHKFDNFLRYHTSFVSAYHLPKIIVFEMTSPP